MLLLKREPHSSEDSHAVAVLDEEVVEVNKGFAEVTGSKVNRGAGYGLKISLAFIGVWTKCILQYN